MSTARATRDAARSSALIGLVLCLAGYGYGPDQDPLIRDFKLLAAHAHSGRWEQADAVLEDLASSFEEVERGLGVDLASSLRRAISRRDGAALAKQLTALGTLAIEFKFESSRREDLSRYYAAKYRVEAARSYYMELLAPAVRRSARDGEDLHGRIARSFDAARAALGKPGFLGRGVVPPSRADFEMATKQIADGLREAFPFVAEVTP